MADKVSLTEAVKLLAATGDVADRSTLSRYVQQHAEALDIERVGKETRVDPEALARHRRENIRLRKLSAPTRPAPPLPGALTQANGAARKVTAEAEMKELHLAREKGLLTPTSEVEDMAREAVTHMRGSLELAINNTAELLASRIGGEARQIRPLLKQMVRTGFDEFSRSMTEIAVTAEEAPQPDTA